MSLSNYLENGFANALRGGGNGTSFTAPAEVWAKLHTGDPGEDGTSNAATETTMKEVEFGAASNGAIALSNAPSWTNVAGTEDYSHISLWDGPDGPGTDNCLGSGTITANAVVTGDQFDLTALTVTIT